jgi:lipoteichoic acid synthase
LLGLLVPLVAYNLTLRASSIVSQPGLALTLDLLRSDVFFNLGYALFWIGLFSAVRGGGSLRRAVVVLFHVATLLVVTVTTCAYQYFRETGTTLDYNIIALWMLKPGEVVLVLGGSVPLSAWVLLFGVLFYVALGPWLLARVVEWWRGWAGRRSPAGTFEVLFCGSLGLWFLAFGFGSLSLLVGSASAGASKSFARDPVVNVVLTGVEEATTEDVPVASVELDTEQSDAPASLVASPETETRNIVLIHLESTRARSVTSYDESLATTPFLDELAGSGLLVERAYTPVPHTSKASVSVNCGIFPHLVQPTTESGPDGIPVPCLADLLQERGYATVLFQSSTKDFENYEGLVRNFGYEEYYPLESMDTEGFERSNYFGYEDDIMLEPSEEWLREHRNEPFVAEYLTGTGHHDYQPPSRYGHRDFSEDELVNRYLNSIRYLDFFVKNLIDQYKGLGLYENTIFVIYGDHGEGFGEHGRFQHDDVVWEEGLRVPLIIHAPGWFGNGERARGLSNHTDVLPTVLEMLGYEVKNGEYPGYSLLRPLPEDRALTFGCFHEEQCLASIEGSEKYIHHYGNQPDELFDLAQDPAERRNLAAGERPEEINERREELLRWRSEVNAAYRRE